jgi:cell wall-associated NlpC family hydrolase
MKPLDPRLTPMRPDLAAAHLQGLVEAPRFAAGQIMHVCAELADLRHAPSLEAGVDTQALYGENVMLYEDDEGWGWVQLAGDDYVGYISMNALAAGEAKPTHRLKVNRSFVYPGPNMKLPPLAALPLGAKIAVAASDGDFVRLAEGGFVFAGHIAPLQDMASDFVGLAEQLLGTPYLWGGKSSLGIDCSGLVQLALAAAGIAAPRDTDMQEERLGAALRIGDDLKGLRRGDLVFWKGHVGIMRDATELLHANAHHMLVVSEPLGPARDRILAKAGAAISAIKRL